MGKIKSDESLSEEMPTLSTSLKRGTAFIGIEGGFKAWAMDFLDLKIHFLSVMKLSLLVKKH